MPSSVNEITSMCKSGQVQQAYNLARADMEQQLPWAQREMGWALYYLIKNDTETANYQSLVSHLDELKSLDQLTISEDNMLFENVLYKVAGYVKACISPTGIDTSVKLSRIFSTLRGYAFVASKGYSFLLQSFIKCEGWREMADFIDWWNFNNLLPEDYTPYQLQNGRTVLSLAERAYIAKSKALLQLNDLGRIEEFLPQIDELIENHPEMLYPGYFYGKMLLALGASVEDALRVIMPFVRRKITEFWVWSLLSDVFVNEPEKQLACLLRAVHCHTQENFLGRVRIKLAALYIQRNQLDYAKYQIEQVTRCYLSQGWRLPYEIDCWVHQPWIQSVEANGGHPVNYMAITDEILCIGTEEAIAVVTQTNDRSQKVTMVYGHEKSMKQKLRFNVKVGDVLKINFISDTNGKLRLLSACRSTLLSNLSYVKEVEGMIQKRDTQPFAFLKFGNENAFVSPNLVNSTNVSNRELVKALIVYGYDSNKDRWNWICLRINKLGL